MDACAGNVTDVCKIGQELLMSVRNFSQWVMTEERFSDLALISMLYKERVPADDICKAFVQAHPRILFQASLFDDCST